MSNGLAWSPSGEVMYYACSSARTVWAFDSEPDDGTIGERRVFVDTSALGGAPDGATVDEEGCYWLTLPAAWKVVRYDPRGQLIRVIDAGRAADLRDVRRREAGCALRHHSPASTAARRSS